MWLPNLKFEFTSRSESSCLRDFIAKNLPLHRAPIIESLCLNSFPGQPEDLKLWVGIAVSRCVRELSIDLYRECLSLFMKSPAVSVSYSFPSSLYTCNSLVTLKLEGKNILVDVPRTVCLPSLKTLRLGCVTYSNDDSLRLLLSYCPVLEDLFIDREDHDNVRAVVIIVPSLQRLTLIIDQFCPSDGYVIVTPSLKYFYVEDYRSESSCLIEHMPELEEAFISLMKDIEKDIEMLLKSITTVKRLSLRLEFNSGKKVICFHLSTSFPSHYFTFRTRNQIFLSLNLLLLLCHVCRLCIVMVMVLSSVSLKI